MKSKLCIAVVSAAALLCVSCASNNLQSINATMKEATIDLGSFPRDQYIIIGQVSGEGKITVKNGTIVKEAKNKAMELPEYNNSSAIGDNGRYGFIGSNPNTNMTVMEKAVAIATYKMIQTAQLNGADTVLYVTTTTTTVPKSLSAFSNESIITAKVTGLAVKIKPNDGIKIKLPEPEEQVIKEVETPAADKATKAKKDKTENKTEAAVQEAATSETAVQPATDSAAETTTSPTTEKTESVEKATAQ